MRALLFLGNKLKFVHMPNYMWSPSGQSVPFALLYMSSDIYEVFSLSKLLATHQISFVFVNKKHTFYNHLVSFFEIFKSDFLSSL